MYRPVRPSGSQFVTVRGLRVHVRSWGTDTDAPPLVLAHGWMDVSASWQFVVDALGEAFFARRRIIAPDWRGFGLSMARDGPRDAGRDQRDHYDLVEYLADLDVLLDHYAGDRPVDLVGHSMGGNVAMLYAGARAARIGRLVNLEGFGMPATRPEHAPGRLTKWLDELRDLRAGRLALRTYADAAGVAARLMKNNPRLSQDKADWLAMHWAAPRAAFADAAAPRAALADAAAPRAALADAAAPRAAFADAATPRAALADVAADASTDAVALRASADGVATRWIVLGEAAHRVINPHLFRVEEMQAIYRAITAPVLVVEASDDSLAGFWEGRYTQAQFHARLEAVPDLRRETLPDCGHMLHHDQPEKLARLLEDFLR